MTSDEELLLDVISNYKKEEYNKCFVETKNEFLVKNLSHIRGNIISNTSYENKKIIEVFAEYGVVTDICSHNAKTVDAYVMTEEQLFICNKKFENNKGVRVHLMNGIDDIVNIRDTFDMAIAVNPNYRNIEELSLVMRSLTSVVKDGGFVYIAIDNKYGLRYWAGDFEPNTKKVFCGLEGYNEYNGVRAFSKKEIEEALAEVNYSNIKWYYPYPDRVFPLSIYSDEYMPKEGELRNNGSDWGETRFISFDESKVYDSLIQDDMYDLFANSYLIELEV